MIKAMRQFVIVLCAVIISLSVTVMGQANHIDSSVPVLLYHHISECNPDNNNYIISPEVFYEHLMFLKNNGYECITPDDYYNYRRGIANLPKKPVIITFDDGYYSNYQYAYPLLKSLKIKATIFIYTAYAEDDSTASYPHFSWEEAREMENSGIIDIQSHSHTHRSFVGLDDSQMFEELALSKELIEKHLGKECNYFAYPNGAYDFKMQNMAENAGYLMQFTTRWGHNTDKQPLAELWRMTVTGDVPAKRLSEYLLPYYMELADTEKNTTDNQVVFDVDYILENNIKAPFECLVILAVYDDRNKLVYYDCKNIVAYENGYRGGFFDITVSDEEKCDSYMLKLFCVKNIGNLLPCTPAISAVLY